MKRTTKILSLVFSIFMLGCVQVFAQQQITKFAVVDTSKVYSAYYRNAAPVKNYENKKAEFQKEITKRTEEIKTLRKKKADYEAAGDTANAQKVQNDITKKTEYLTDYTNAKNAELETMLNNLQKSDEFYKKLYKTLQKVAESGGYSMILSLQDSNSILWYSSSVDITETVISELGL